MKTRNYSALPLAALAALAGLALAATSANATIVEINGIGLGNNTNLPATFASNLSSDIGGATVSNGATPDIALAWALSGNGWEVHSSGVWDALDPSTGTADILQMDKHGVSAGDNPTVTFTVGATVALQLNSLDIGHASDQNEPAFAWTITISEVGGSQVFSHTTAAMVGGDTEAVTFNFTGDVGVDYILKLDDGGANTNRGAIDNLSFGQVIPGPDLTPPTIISPTDPADDSTDVAVDTNFVASFNENIALTATGTITVTDGSETRVVNLDGSADDGDASVLDNVLTITLDTDLTNPGSTYDVLISNDAIVDTAPAQNPFAGTSAGDWSFTTAIPPVPGTIIHINGIGLGNNTDLPATFASNLSSDIGGATVSNGGTPGIALAWALSGNGWEVHGSDVWNALDPSTGTADILQMDRRGSSDNPTVTFTVGAGVALHLNSLDIGHASDQNEPAFAWTITISEVGGAQVFSHTTAAMVGGDTEAVTFNFTGVAGVDYILEFDDEGAATERGAIDNLSFAQIASSGGSFQLIIENQGTGLDFTWASLPGKLYDLVSSTDLSTAPTTWPVYDPDGAGGNDPYGDIASGGTTTILENVPGGGEPKRFFAVLEKDP